MKRRTPFAVLLASACVASPADELGELERAIAQLSRESERASPVVEVQHILVAVKGARMPNGLSQAEARALAASLLVRVTAGADFVGLMKDYSADPGSRNGSSYTMFDASKGGKPAPGTFPRTGMVRAFGDVGWRLDVGGVGVAAHDTRTSPFGYHIIKRVR